MRFLSESLAVRLSLHQDQQTHRHHTHTCPRTVTVTAFIIDLMTPEAYCPVLGVVAVSGARTHVFTCQV